MDPRKKPPPSPPKKKNSDVVQILCQENEFEFFLKQIRKPAVGLGSSFIIHVIRLSTHADNRDGLCRLCLVFRRCVLLTGEDIQDNILSNLITMNSISSFFPSATGQKKIQMQLLATEQFCMSIMSMCTCVSSGDFIFS